MSEQISNFPKDQISKTWSDTVYLDSEGKIYFKGVKTTSRWSTFTKKFEKVSEEEITLTPEQCGLKKSMELEVFIIRSGMDEQTMERKQGYFRGVLLVEIPNEKRYKFFYLKETRHIRLPCVKDLSSGTTSLLSVNDPEFTKWLHKPKRLPEDSPAPDLKTQLVFTESVTGLERVLETNLSI